MTIWEFVLTPMHEQARYVSMNGRYLTSREEHWTRIHLYALHTFYVEIRVDKGRNAIANITAFESISKLDAYLKGISLEGLL